MEGEIGQEGKNTWWTITSVRTPNHKLGLWHNGTFTQTT